MFPHGTYANASTSTPDRSTMTKVQNPTRALSALHSSPSLFGLTDLSVRRRDVRDFFAHGKTNSKSKNIVRYQNHSYVLDSAVSEHLAG